MRYSLMTLEKEQRLRLLLCGIRFFLTAALTANQTPGSYAPFALGCVAASGSGGFPALLGAGLGALAFMEFADALPFLAAAVLIFTLSAALRGLRVLERPWFASLAGGGAFLLVAGIYALETPVPGETLTPLLASSVLTGVSAWFYRPVLSGGQARLEPDSLLFLAASLFLSLGDVGLWEASVGRTLLCLLLLFTAVQRGVEGAVATGLGVGLMADLCAGDGRMLCTAAYALAGLFAGSRNGRLRAAGAFLAGTLTALLPAAGERVWPLLLEAGAGTALFCLLPRRLFGGKRLLRPELQSPAVSTAMDRLRGQLNRTAAALRELYDSMGRTAQPDNDENPAIVFDRAAEKVCRSCSLCGICWQREYTGTFNALNDATPFLLERGRALPKDFPAYFADRCIHLPEFLTAVNGELSAFLLRRQYRRQLEETRSSARGQYAQLSELLTATAAGLGAARSDACRGAAYQIGAVLRPREGERVCGDSIASFQTEEGLLCLLLADGMGSGEAARRESALVCRLMQQFLEAGIEPDAALKTLNAAMALRGAEIGSFPTIDLIACRPDRREAVFYKFGAAPSYIKRSGTVRRITGASLPAGLRGTPAAPDVTRAALDPGSFAVQISDGVADPGEDAWLQDLLAGWEGEDPQALAGCILEESVRREGLQDDCGIQVLYLAGDGGVQEV